jgi:AcrR family transcriptional regulator
MSQGVNQSQRSRTRRALIDGALNVMRRGAIPSVADAAEDAGISRATAYRYFNDSSSLVASVLAETVRPIAFEEAAPEMSDDPVDRTARFLDVALPILAANDAQLRVALRLALEQNGDSADVPSIGRGTRLGYLHTALEPLRLVIDEHVFERTVAALAVVVGIEAQVVLRDLCQFDDRGVEDVIRWTCETIVHAAIASGRSGGQRRTRTSTPASPSPRARARGGSTRKPT